MCSPKLQSGTELCVSGPAPGRAPPYGSFPSPSNYTVTTMTIIPGTWFLQTPTTASAPASTTSSSCAIYKVATGDTCISIATSKGISVSQIEQWNPNKCGKGLQAGHELCIPPSPVSSITASAISTGPMPPSTTCAAGTCCKYCKVAPGDSCDSIASVEDIFSSRIEQWNPGQCGDNLQIGVELCIDGPDLGSAPPFGSCASSTCCSYQ